jgi:hypothetical protein
MALDDNLSDNSVSVGGSLDNLSTVELLVNLEGDCG